MLTIGCPSNFFCVSFVSFVFGGSAWAAAPWANKDEIDDNKAARVCVVFPGFMASQAAARQKFRRAPLEKDSTEFDALVNRIWRGLREILSRQIFRDSEYRLDRERV